MQTGQHASAEPLPILRPQIIPIQRCAPGEIGNIVGGAIQRLIGAVLLEANDEWQLQQRYMPIEGMAGFAPVLPEEAITAIPPKAA